MRRTGLESDTPLFKSLLCRRQPIPLSGPPFLICKVDQPPWKVSSVRAGRLLGRGRAVESKASVCISLAPAHFCAAPALQTVATVPSPWPGPGGESQEPVAGAGPGQVSRHS